MGEGRSRPIVTATVSQEAFDYIKLLQKVSSFNKSVFLDRLILTHKKVNGGKRRKSPRD